MTSPEPTPHLSLDALADLLAGEGSDADLAHVGACAGCAGRLDELSTADAEVAAVLAALPAPAMPSGLAERLSAAFAAEPALEPAPPSEGPVALGDGARAVSAGAPPAGSSGSATVTPFPDARKRRSWLPAAAGVALVLAGGALGASLLLGGSDGEDETAAGGASSDSAAAPAEDFSGLTRNETGTDYAAEGTLATALPALLDGSAEALASAPMSAAEPPQGDELGPVSESGEAAPAPAEPLDAAGRLDVSDGPDPALDRLRTAEGLASCLTAVLPPEDPSVRPLTIDYAAYQGQPALVVVLPAGGAADKVDVFVVGAGCAVGNDATLFFTRLDRPA